MNERDRVECDTMPDRVVMSNYKEGDVFRSLKTEAVSDSVECEIGLANAAGVYELKAGSQREVCFTIPLARELERQFPGFDMEPRSWSHYLEISGERLPRKWLESAVDGTQGIARKRRKDMANSPHPGLLPAGFSAEHFGPNDYYYWDDFWNASGLRCAASMLERSGNARRAKSFEAESFRFERDIWKSICAIPEKRAEGAIPASPNRRMDAGAVGSLVADYPLRMTRPGNPRILRTAEFLMGNCFHSGGFFQDMIHSGINAYLTLDIAQTLLRTGDRRFFDLVRAVADLASPTGQWPEAIHPITKGGCMGDGQHGWAAAERSMAVKNMFVREEDDRLILGSGIEPDWLASDGVSSFGPTPMPWDDVSVEFNAKDGRVFMTVNGKWKEEIP